MSKVDEIRAKFGAGEYSKYINVLSMPYYANIEPHAIIHNNFPITVLVGRNGSGKSRVLQALYGAPRGYSMGTFWFNTDVDPIKEKHEVYGYPNLAYSYKSSGVDALVSYSRRVRRRSGKIVDPDYWETVRVSQTLAEAHNIAIDRERYEPIDMNVIYIDSKAELSAYDRCFHFIGNGSERRDYSEIKEYIRKKSKYLSTTIKEGKIHRSGNKPQVHSIKDLSGEALHKASVILGKSYSETKLILHKHYKLWGESIVINDSYTDARAGSGELKVIKIVSALVEASIGSLVLLDEPETSLHPGAQEKLLDFLLEMSLRKKLQVIFTSHSPYMIEKLPKEAIKVFVENEQGRFSILEDVDPKRALYYIGTRTEHKRKIVVEDILAKRIVDSVLESHEDIASLVDVTFCCGGDKDILCSTIPQMAEHEIDDVYYLLDGDVRFDMASLDLGRLTAEQVSDRQNYLSLLDELIQNTVDISVQNIRFSKDSNMGLERKIEQREKYIEVLRNNVQFLPGMQPEGIIYDEDNFVISRFVATDEFAQIEKHKARIYYSAKKILDSETEDEDVGAFYEVIINDLMKKWKRIKNQDYYSILDTVTAIAES